MNLKQNKTCSPFAVNKVQWKKYLAKGIYMHVIVQKLSEVYSSSLQPECCYQNL